MSNLTQKNRIMFFPYLLWISFALLWMGCSTTLHERKATETDLGTKTELKLMGPRVKVVHDF
jgi:hypothetical protein